MIYYGRTAWFLSECFKDYEVYINDSSQPAAKGTLAMAHGAADGRGRGPGKAACHQVPQFL